MFDLLGPGHLLDCFRLGEICSQDRKQVHFSCGYDVPCTLRPANPLCDCYRARSRSGSLVDVGFREGTMVLRGDVASDLQKLLRNARISRLSKPLMTKIFQDEISSVPRKWATPPPELQCP